MTATHEEIERGINGAVLVLGPLAYEPGKLTSAEAWALGVLTGTALRLLALLRGPELPSRGQGACCFHYMNAGNTRMDCPAQHREDNAEVIYLRKLLHDTADKMHDLEWRSEEKVKALDAEIERLNALLSGR